MKPSKIFNFLAAAIPFVSLAVIAVIYGIIATWWNWFPAPQVGLAHRTIMDVSANWKNDLGLEPTRHLVKPISEPVDPERGFSGEITGSAADGYILVAGLSERQGDAFHAVRLYDANGEEVHRWPVHYDLLDSEHAPENVMLHGMEVFEDGSLAVTFDGGQSLARIDACGEPIWKQNDRYHHTINRDGEGRLVTLLDDKYVLVDEDTGETLNSMDIRTDMMEFDDGAHMAMLKIRTRTPENADEGIEYLTDPFHPNDAEPLRAEMAEAFPMFEVGDVLLSLRELNLITVVDPETGRMKWWHYGPWFKQHDPDFQPDGTITVMDNATGTGSSRILSVRPGEDEVKTLFEGTEEVPYYTWRRGKHQILPDGNILLTEAEGGRVLEVTPEGEQIWERHFPWDEDHNVIITEARFVPKGFFKDGIPSCDKEEAS